MEINGSFLYGYERTSSLVEYYPATESEAHLATNKGQLAGQYTLGQIAGRQYKEFCKDRHATDPRVQARAEEAGEYKSVDDMEMVWVHFDDIVSKYLPEAS
jgi:hypothetical protein